jgi:hypothetical protein
MSMIHCSPLFHPLEPLPIMSPTVMRSTSKKTNGNARRSGSRSKSSPNTQTQESGSASSAKRKNSTPHHTVHPLADTPLTMPVNSPLPPPPLSETLPDDNLAMLLEATSAAASQEYSLTSSYTEASFDPSLQGSLTFTVESQPMSDLSSSQQQGQT